MVHKMTKSTPLLVKSWTKRGMLQKNCAAQFWKRAGSNFATVERISSRLSLTWESAAQIAIPQAHTWAEQALNVDPGLERPSDPGRVGFGLERGLAALPVVHGTRTGSGDVPHFGAGRLVFYSYSESDPCGSGRRIRALKLMKTRLNKDVGSNPRCNASPAIPHY